MKPRLISLSFLGGGYSKTGEPFIIETLPRTRRLSILSAISTDRYLAYQIFDGSVKGDDYGAFIQNLVIYL